MVVVVCSCGSCGRFGRCGRVVEKPDVEDVKEGSPGDRLRGVKVANCCSVFFPLFEILYLPCFGYSQLCVSDYFMFSLLFCEAEGRQYHQRLP